MLEVCSRVTVTYYYLILKTISSRAIFATFFYYYFLLYVVTKQLRISRTSTWTDFYWKFCILINPIFLFLNQTRNNVKVTERPFHVPSRLNCAYDYYTMKNITFFINTKFSIFFTTRYGLILFIALTSLQKPLKLSKNQTFDCRYAVLHVTHLVYSRWLKCVRNHFLLIFASKKKKHALR